MTETGTDQPAADDHDRDGVPHTGEPAVDDALQGLRDLDAAPLNEHHERLSRIHEDLHRALNPE